MQNSYERGPLSRRPTHPGEALGEALSAMGISADDFASRIDVRASTLFEIIDGKQPFTAEIADKVGNFMGDGPGIWLRMQAAHDNWEAPTSGTKTASLDELNDMKERGEIRSNPEAPEGRPLTDKFWKDAKSKKRPS